jgi:hypothetical protein
MRMEKQTDNFFRSIISTRLTSGYSSAVGRLFVRLAEAVGRQSAFHKENSGFAAITLGRHISTFRGYLASSIIFLFIHNHLTLKKLCYTRLQHEFALDPIISSFDFHFRTYKRDLAILTEWWPIATKRGNVPTADFLMESALTSHGSSKSNKKPSDGRGISD